MMLAGVKTLIPESRAEPKKCSSLVRLVWAGEGGGRQTDTVHLEGKRGGEEGGEWRGTCGDRAGQTGEGGHKGQLTRLWRNGNRKEPISPSLLPKGWNANPNANTAR